MPAPRQRRRLMELRRDPNLASRERDRVEMYLLSADGMTVPVLARHFGRCEATMRRRIRQFEEEGLKAVRHKQLGTGPDLERRLEVRRALNRLLSRQRTWTAAQLAEALAEEKGIVMQPPTVRKYLHLMGASYRRTKYSLRHRQDPERAAAARAELDDFKKKPPPGTSTSSSWTKPARPLPAPHPHLVPAPTAARSSPRELPGTARERAGGPRARPQGNRKSRKSQGKKAAAPDLVGGRPHLEGRGFGQLPATRPAAGPRRSARGGHGQRLHPPRAEGEGRPAGPAQTESPFVLPCCPTARN